jgi:hypothetical protein
MLRYLDRYTHRVAISNDRLLAFEQERVTLRRKERITPTAAAKPDDPCRHGVPTSLLSARTSQRVRTHPPLRLPGKSPACLSLGWHCAGNCWLRAPLHPQKPEPVKAPPRVLPFGTAGTCCAVGVLQPALSVHPWPSSCVDWVPNCHSNPITQRVRRNRQRLPPSLFIENVSDLLLALPEHCLAEAFPIKASDNAGVGPRKVDKL